MWKIIWKKIYRLMRELTSGERLYYYRAIKQYCHYLEHGSYWLFRDDSRWIWEKSTVMNWLRKTFRQRPGILLRAIIFKNHCTVKEESNALGDNLIISRAKIAVKIVDKNKEHIVSFYSDKNELDRINAFRDDFLPFFGPSTIIGIDCNGMRVTEWYIDSKKEWWRDRKLLDTGIIWLMDSCLAYATSTTPSSSVVVCELVERAKREVDRKIKCGPAKEELRGLIKRLDNELKACLRDKIPVLKVHGDINFNNMLFDGDNFWLIDCELYGDDVFFFDALWWIIWNAVVVRDCSYLKNYYDGAYDKWLSQIFLVAHFPFIDSLKRQYIIIIIIGLFKHVDFIEKNSKRIDALLDYDHAKRIKC